VAHPGRPDPLLTLAKLAGAIVLTGVIAAGFLLPYIGGLGLAARAGADKFLTTSCTLVEAPVEQKTTIYAADATTKITEVFDDNRTVIPFDQIPVVARQALVDTEDRRFYEHHGVDLRGLIRAAANNSDQTTQGASTLTQQYVKQVRLYQAKNDEERRAAIEQTVDRKIYEAQCALDLEETNTKDQILEKYFNIAFFGENSYGIEAAANTYFGIPASQLSVPQAAMIVGTVQSPSDYNPYDFPDAAKARRDLVISNMVKEGDLAPADGDAAIATPLELAPRQPVKRGCAYAEASIVNVGFFCDYAYQWLTSDEGGGLAANTVDTSGWSIVTSIEPNLQNTIQASLQNDMEPGSPSAAVMPVIDPATGAIRAMGTSRLYGNVPGDPAYTTDPLFTSAYSGTGSTYKYFTMLAALKAGADSSLSLTAPSPYTPKNCSQKGDKLTSISNAGGYANTLTLRNATIQSSNTYFVALEDQVFGCDLSPIVNTALDLGVDSLRRIDANGQSRANNIIAGTEYGYTLGMEVTSAMELTSAYGAVANDGIYCPPVPILRVLDAAGNPVPFATPQCSRQLEPTIARTALNILVGDTNEGQGTAYGAFRSYYNAGGSPVAGKTGTNNDESDDYNAALWFVGVTPHLVSAAALVNPLTPTTPILDAPGYRGNASNAYGAVSAGVWVRALSEFIRTVEPRWSWPTADSVPGQVNVPLVLGKSPAEAIQILSQAGFQVFQKKTDCGLTNYPKGSVASSTPKRAVPGATVMICLSNGQAPTPTPSTTAPTVPGQVPSPGTSASGGVVTPGR